MPSETRVKGTVLSGLVRAANGHASGEPRDFLLARLTGDLREAAETNTLMPTAWYPVSWYRDLLGALKDDHGPSKLADFVRRATRDSVGTVHRILVRAFTPDMLLSRTTRIFSSFFDASCESRKLDEGVARVEWAACHGFDRTCWSAQLHTVEELVVMTGAKLTHRAVLGGGQNGDAFMALELRWR